MGKARLFPLALVGAFLWSCGGEDAAAPPIGVAPTPTPTPTPAPTPAPVTGVTATAVATFETAWAMDFLTPDRILVSERGDVTVQQEGRLWLTSTQGERAEIQGMPENTGVYYVLRSPDYTDSGLVYVSYFEPGGPDVPRVGRNAADTNFKPEALAVLRARLETRTDTDLIAPTLRDVEVIWRHEYIVPIPTGFQISAYMAFSPDGQYLFICGGARDEFDSVQDIGNALGTTVRIFPDGTIPPDNPFAQTPGARADIWSYGHRNVYGIGFAPDGRLWQTEHGPEGGDEVNLILPGANYGWPLASNGRNNGAPTNDIPDHVAGDGFEAPRLDLEPTVAPAGLFFYTGTVFGDWQGDAIIGGLISRSLVRLRFDGEAVAIVQEIPMNTRVRHVSQAPDGSIWAIEDFPTGPNGGGAGRILKLDPVFGG